MTVKWKVWKDSSLPKNFVMLKISSFNGIKTLFINLMQTKKKHSNEILRLDSALIHGTNEDLHSQDFPCLLL